MSESILIVDDERGIRETLSAVLRDEGFIAESVESGEACLKALAQRAFGCVLLDVWLPGINGLETLKQMRESNFDAAVVIISGHGNVETAVRATKLGAFDFIEKPLSIEKTVLTRSEEHTSELQSLAYLVCRLLLENKNTIITS